MIPHWGFGAPREHRAESDRRWLGHKQDDPIVQAARWWIFFAKLSQSAR
jgi:hypothetical protein